MSPYKVEYTESEYDMQNNDLLYTKFPKCQIIFEMSLLFVLGGKIEKQECVILLFI